MEARVIQTALITMLYLPNRVGVRCPDVGSTLDAGLVRRRLKRRHRHRHRHTQARAQSLDLLKHYYTTACMHLTAYHPSFSIFQLGRVL